MKKLLFVFNPHSGRGQIGTYLLDIIEIFTEAGYDVTAHPTCEKLDAYRYICDHGTQFDRIVISGGDGTLSEAVSALMMFDREDRVELGYVPSGTTNDFAAALGIPRDMRDAARIAAYGSDFDCDIGLMNGNAFNYVAAFGAFTDVSYDTPQETKNALGHAAYIWEGIKRLPSLQAWEVNIRYDEGELSEKVSLCLILNSTSIGGVLNTGKLMNVELNDGLFEMLVFSEPTNPVQFQRALKDIVLGNPEGQGYKIVKSKRFEITSSEPLKWTLDGEYGGEFTHTVIEVIPSAVTYLAGGENEEGVGN